MIVIGPDLRGLCGVTGYSDWSEIEGDYMGKGIASFVVLLSLVMLGLQMFVAEQPKMLVVAFWIVLGVVGLLLLFRRQVEK